MRFGPQVERWRHLAGELAGGIPVNLVLGIIWRESGGKPGAIGQRKTKCAMIPSSSGPRRVCRAIGLMQVVARNVASWNRDNPDQVITYETMTGKTPAAVRRQIQLGVSILRSSLAWLKQYGFPWPGGKLSDEQIKIGLMIYLWGPGNMGPYLDELQATGRPITAAGISSRWPELGQPANQPLRYSRNVWNKAFGAGIIPGPQKHPARGLGWGILAIVAMAAIATTR